MTRLSYSVAAAASLLVLSAPPSAAQSNRAFDTDQTIPVTRGTRLLLQNFAGEVIVRASNRDQVQLRARHNSRTRVEAKRGDGTLRVSASSMAGTNSVDYDLIVPSWMPMSINGTFTYIETDSVKADISAETVRGDILVKGGSGVIALKSIEGEVHVEDASGRITVSSVNEGVFLERCSGDIKAETVNGEIRISDASASSVDAGTVNGDVLYIGSVADRGLYRFSTHQGDIVLGLPEKLNATITVRTYQGEFETTLPINTGEARRGRRQIYTVGNGSAQIELESFNGEIVVNRASEVRERKRERR